MSVNRTSLSSVQTTIAKFEGIGTEGKNQVLAHKDNERTSAQTAVASQQRTYQPNTSLQHKLGLQFPSVKDKIAKLEADIAASKAPAAQQQHGAAVPAKDLGVEFPSVKDKVVKLEADIAASKAPAAQQQYSAAAPAKNLGVEFPSVKDKVVKLEADIAASKAPAAQQQHGAAAPAKDLGVEFPSVKDKVVKLEADIAASKALAAQQVEQQMGDIRSAHTYHLQGMNKLFGEQNTQAAAGTAQPGSHDQVQSGQVNGNATKYQTQMDELTAMQQQTAIDSARVQAHQGQQALQALIMDGILAQMRRISDAIKALGQLG